MTRRKTPCDSDAKYGQAQMNHLSKSSFFWLANPHVSLIYYVYIYIYIYIWVSINRGPKNWRFIRETPINMDDMGGTPILGNHHILT
jgi:hypothetical protein